MLIWCLTMAIVQNPTHANALELFGICLTGNCKDTAADNSDIIDPKNYQVDLIIDDNTSEDIDLTLKSASELWRGREKAIGGSAGLVSRAKGDYRRLLAGLYNEGYYGGEISILINGQQASGLKPGDELPSYSTVTINVSTGDIYRFGTFDIFNQTPTPDNENDRVERPISLKVESGDIAKAKSVGTAGRLAIAQWRQQGYPNAKIGGQSVKALHNQNILNVNLSIDPGQKAAYGTTQVDGTERMDQAFVAYMTGLNEGDEFDPDDINEAKKRLSKLDVFSVQKIETADSVSEDGKVLVKVSVQEKKRRRIGVGATISSTDGAGLSAFWMNRNLFGKAESLRLEAEIDGLGNTFEVDELGFRLGATFIKPGVFTPYTDWVTNIFAEHEFNSTFEGEVGGGSSVLTHRLTDKVTVSGGGFYEYSRFKDAFGTRNFSTIGAMGDIAFDNRDSKVEPTKGFFAKLAAKPFYEFENQNLGARIDAEVKGYYAFDPEGKTVLAGRIKVGSVFGPVRDQVPTNFLYLAGGGGSVRGFGFNNIGIVDGAGKVSGGRSLLETSVEVRQKFSETIGAVAFVDGAIVGKDPIIDFSQDFRMSAGLGLRYYTSLGPIRLDFAVPINPKSGDPDFGIFAGIGQAF